MSPRRKRGRLAVLAIAIFVAGLFTGSANSLRAHAGTLHGIDVSQWQRSINWGQVAGSGVSFAYIRATFGAGYVDPYFQSNWAGARAAGVVPGAYLFFQPADDPVAQANLLVQQIRQAGFARGDLLPTIDVEDTNNLPASTVVANLQTTVNAVAQAIGSYPAIYTAPSWWNSHVGSANFIADPLWIANWGVSSPSVPASNWGGNGWQVWQYADNGSVSGISGNVDMDQSGAGLLPYYGVAGLLPQQSSIPLSSHNVAGAPQLVSDRSGEADVLWRGTDNRLWTIGYRNLHWAPQSTAVSSNNLASDPTVVSTGAGNIDAFWQGTDSNLWHSHYTAGYFGSGSWSPPDSLSSGSSVQSAPSAVSVGAGAVDIFWKGPGGTLYADRYNGTNSSFLPISGTALVSTPYAVAIGNGAAEVFWRGSGNNLWSDTVTPWASGSPRLMAWAALGSDPAPVSDGQGNVDVFWRGSDGTLWHMAQTSGSWSAVGQISSQQIVGNTTAVETSPGSITVVVQRTDGILAAVITIRSIGFVGPELLGDGPVGSSPTAVAYSQSAIYVYWRGQDYGLWYSPACPGCGQVPTPVAVRVS